MVRIISIDPGSIAEELTIQPGDYIVSINEQTINDRLDYRFYQSGDKIDLHIKHQDSDVIYEIEKEPQEDIGLELDEMKMKACGNNCVFCFVYQNPGGMRKTLYFKDEDYRFSFLYGHYVTMTTLKQKDLDRIVEQRLSPLYISVHSTEEKTRKLLLGIKREDFLLEKIDYLTRNGIELHAQIVLCPGINDGEIFDRTVSDLKKFYPGVKSIAVVPVGLTRHRQNLFKLRIHTRAELRQMIKYADNLRAKIRKDIRDGFVYLSDEFYIKAGLPMPGADYYDEFYQIENGVGEFREMIDNLNEARENFPGSLPDPLNITWITGKLAEGPLKHFIIPALEQTINLNIDVVAVENQFYGPDIKVSGLLTGQDICNQLIKTELGDLVLLPPRVLNDDGYFLDDWTVSQIETKINKTCHVYSEPLSEFFEVIGKLRSEILI
jgi:putative radical SAM enzyme (TIGR03279 family)